MYKKFIKVVIILCVFVVWTPINCFAISTDVKLTAKTFINVAKETLPAVVRVEVNLPMADFEGNTPNWRKLLPHLFPDMPEDHPELQGENLTISSASGVLISHDGYVVTANHLIEEKLKEHMKVILYDGREFEGDKIKLIGTEPFSDIAILKIEGKDLPHLSWGDSERLEVGELVLAVGNPLELDGSVSQGIVSAKGRDIGKSVVESLIQTTAVINPGSSGGPLVNLNGEIVSINTAIASQNGLWYGVGFAVPSSEVRYVAENLIEKGSVPRGFLGITMQNLNAPIMKYYNINNSNGVLVVAIVPGSAASKSDIKIGDIITEINGITIENTLDLLKTVAPIRPGRKTKVKLLRLNVGNLTDSSFELKLGTRPVNEDLDEISFNFETIPLKDEPIECESAGFKISAVSDEFAKNEAGVAIYSVENDTPASRAGLNKADFISQINFKVISSPEKAVNLINAAEKKGEPVLILFKRPGVTRMTVIDFDKPE